jgi:membrane fusion protein, multidrug efflux system
VSGAHASVEQAEQQLAAAKARVAQAQANSTKADADLERYKPLVEKDVISKQQFDAAVAAADGGQGGVADAQARAGCGRRRASGARDRSAGAGVAEVCRDRPAAGGGAECARQAGEAQVQQAQAQLDQAELNLSYTKIVAPAAGIITRKSVEVNQNVASGRTC